YAWGVTSGSTTTPGSNPGQHTDWDWGPSSGTHSTVDPSSGQGETWGLNPTVATGVFTGEGWLWGWGGDHASDSQDFYDCPDNNPWECSENPEEWPAPSSHHFSASVAWDGSSIVLTAEAGNTTGDGEGLSYRTEDWQHGSASYTSATGGLSW